MNGEQESTDPNTPLSPNDPSRDGTQIGGGNILNNERKPTVGITEALSQGITAETKESTVRTFQSDVADAVKTDNVSMIKIALAEKERREHEGQYADLNTKTPIKSAYIITGFVCLAILLTLGGAYWFFNRPPSPTLEQLIAPLEPEIIYSETQVAVSINKKTSDMLIADLRKETQTKLDLGTIKRILVTSSTGTSTRNISSGEFLAAIKSRSSDSLRRSIDPYFVLGAYSFQPHDVFIIFKINSYDIAYPSMLAWEPYMDIEFSDLFVEKKVAPAVVPQPVQPQVQSTTTESTAGTSEATSTTAISTSTDTQTASTTTEEVVPVATTTPTATVPKRTTTDVNKPVWKDRILQNKDTRVLVDTDGNIRFLYSFIDKNTLVIVSSEKGFKEIITRVTTGRISR